MVIKKRSEAMREVCTSGGIVVYRDYPGSSPLLKVLYSGKQGYGGRDRIMNEE